LVEKMGLSGCDAGSIKANSGYARYKRFARQSQPKTDLSTEDEIHGGIFSLIRTIAPDVLCFHPANGFWRSKAAGSKLKLLGVTPGIPDLCLIDPVGRVFFIEVKTATGRLSPEQVAIHSWLTAIGVPCAVCRGVDDARNALAAWNIKTREHDPLAQLDPKTRQAWRESAIAWRAESPEEHGTDK
jgi:hypothetical protein